MITRETSVCSRHHDPSRVEYWAIGQTGAAKMRWPKAYEPLVVRWTIKFH